MHRFLGHWTSSLFLKVPATPTIRPAVPHFLSASCLPACVQDQEPKQKSYSRPGTRCPSKTIRGKSTLGGQTPLFHAAGLILVSKMSSLTYEPESQFPARWAVINVMQVQDGMSPSKGKKFQSNVKVYASRKAPMETIVLHQQRRKKTIDPGGHVQWRAGRLWRKSLVLKFNQIIILYAEWRIPERSLKYSMFIQLKAKEEFYNDYQNFERLI